jgi:hypothetical protein
MKVLAIAKKNEGYVWKKTFEKCIIEVVLENEHITFLEYYNNKVNTLSEELVQSLFPKEENSETPIRECPFLIKDNVDFYTILNRKKEVYKKAYQKILELSNKPKIVCTTVPETKKTFKRTK